MAVAPTGAIYKALEFDGVSSRTYGVYITGEAVYNAPERDVEMITIPGRSGSFALDKGRFENIEVTYPAGIYAESQEDFAAALSDLRNMLCSRRGYCRLEDEYNPDEYRMAVYKSGLDVDPAAFQRAGEFEITFECKPQRWLKSGEAKQTIATSGDTITNPTLFESGPLLEVEGYGTLEFNGYEIEIENAVMGDVIIANKKKLGIGSQSQVPFVLDWAALNTGDAVTLSNKLSWVYSLQISGNTFKTSPQASASDSYSGVFTTTVTNDSTHIYATTTLSSFVFNKGTDQSASNTVTISVQLSNGTTVSISYTVQIIASHNYGNSVILKQSSLTISPSATIGRSIAIANEDIYGYSTKSILGNPTYIDCDLGACYLISGGEAVSLDAYIDLGSELPTLAPGTTTFTKDNTITSLKVTPRWWKV